jgi:drug/metabolite transporter (DMT)-like permease
MNKNYATVFALLSTVVLWGLSFIAIKIALESFPPIIYMFLRFSLASLVLLSILMLRGFPRLDKITHLQLFLTGLFEPGLYFFFETLGLTMTSASKASIILATIPILVMILARIFLHESIHKRSFYAIFLSVAGICLLVMGHSTGIEVSTSVTGDLLTLGAAVSAALYMICARNLGSQLSALVITAFQMFYGTLMFLPVFVFKSHAFNWSTANLESSAAIIFLALFCTVGGYSLYNYALTQIPASEASVFLNGVPVVTTIAAAFMLGERLAPVQLTGGILVLVAVFMANLPVHNLPKALTARRLTHFIQHHGGHA